MHHHFHIHSLIQTVLGGTLLTREQGEFLAGLDSTHTMELLWGAHAITRAMGHASFTCSIVNAKSGLCSQDCAFCAQSRHHATQVKCYPLLPEEDLIAHGLAMHAAGAACFSLVTSGLGPSEAEIEQICRVVRTLREKTDLSLSASLGLLQPSQAAQLRAAGLQRYHHNLETARSFFSHICTTHGYEQDMETVRVARQAGLSVCCGGILGLGESFAQRMELALTLRELAVDTVPLNFLRPIAGTRLADTPPLSVHDALKSVALFRYMLPQARITIAGGREFVLGDYQSWLPLAGANGLMIGSYLTTQGRNLEQDARMREQGQWI
ncbi:biotin synthase BioB [Desulfovibrionales bacterium]